MPVTGEYFVLPSMMARIAAILMLSGVSKSGSPADSAITSRPALAISIALAEMTMEGDALIRLMRCAAMDITNS